MAEIQKKVSGSLPYITGFLLFLLVSALYFSPQFSGREIVMGDVVQFDGMSREIIDHEQRYGEDPQWTGAMFGGMPAQLIHMRYDDSVILRGLQDVFGFMGRPASFIFVTMAAFFIMLLLFGVDPWVGIIPSLAYGLSTYFFLIIGAGHITKMLALAYAPLVLGGMGYAFRGNMWLGAALTALFASLQIGCNHPQITYYFLFAMVALWINEGIKAYKSKGLPRFAKVSGLLVIAGILAVGSNFAPLWYTYDYGKKSMRGGSELTADAAENEGLELEYATAWSYGRTESFNMFIPDLEGGSSDGGFASDGPVAQSLSAYGARNMAGQLPAYWGGQPGTGGPTYIGAVVIFLCVLGLFLLRGRSKWWVLAVSALAIMLAWGRNFMWLTEFFFDYVPGYNKFRTVAMILCIVQWSVPLLAALILNKVWRGELTKKEIASGLKKALYVTGGVALFFLIFGGMLFDFTAAFDAQLPQDVAAAMRDERAGMLRADSFRSLIFVLLTAGTVWLFALGKIKKWALVTLLAVLVCADLIPVDLRFLPQSRFVEKERTEIQPSQADMQILADSTPGFRVANLTVSPFNDATTSYFHRSIGGYHGAKLQRYQDIIDHYLSQSNMEIYNMLNTRYFIEKGEDGAPHARYNPDANGAAWFVDAVTLVDTPDEEIAALGTIDTKREAVADKRFAEYLTATVTTADSTSYIRLTDYRSNRLIYEYEASAETFAVFSEIYYDKGWSAWIDGVQAPYFRADYILRGMVLPAGKHTVEFRYRAEDFDTVSGITLLFSVLIVAGVAGAAAGILMGNRKKKRDAGQQKTQA